LAQRAQRSAGERLRNWVADTRALAGRIPRRYASVEVAFARMQAENRHLTPDQARYLTVHGASQNEDGSYSWKFDNYVRSFSPVDLTPAELQELWGEITCPILLVNGKESWAANPQREGQDRFFQHAQVAEIEGAGHWVHHDRLDVFLAELRA